MTIVYCIVTLKRYSSLMTPKNTLTHELERIETLGEAIANSITHGVGLLLSIVALGFLILFSAMEHDSLKIISSIIYGSSLVITYLSSTLYHSVPQTRKVKRFFRIMDHSAIFLLIAGTYTPFALISLNGLLGWTLFSVVWGLALFGIIFKLIFKHKYEPVSLSLYLIMGWLVVVAIKPIAHALVLPALILMVAGGLAYTFGVIFYAWKRPFNHTIWHVFVLIGSTCHYFAILLYVIVL